MSKNLIDFSDLIDDIASTEQDANVASKGGGDYVPPAEGRGARIRFVGYIEVGVHKQRASAKNPKPKSTPGAWLLFELHGKNWPYKEIEVDGAKVQVPHRITVKLKNKSLNEKAEYFKLFNRMKGDSTATTFVQLLGEGYLADVKHFKINEGKDDEVIVANFRDDEGALTIRAARIEQLDDEGEVVSVKVKVPDQISDLRLFVWNSKPEHIARMWPTIVIEGEKDGVKTYGQYVDMIVKAENYQDSPIQAYIESLGVDLGIPDAKDEKGSKAENKKAKEEAEPADEDDILNGVGD